MGMNIAIAAPRVLWDVIWYSDDNECEWVVGHCSYTGDEPNCLAFSWGADLGDGFGWCST